MGMLDGKTAIVTGAGRGLGREEAILMAKEGCNLIINDLGVSHDGSGSGKIADEVVAEIKAFGGKAIGNYDSVTDFNKTKQMVDQAVSEFGKLDIVVNNAGILRDKMIFNMDEDDWDLVISVHLKGTFNLCRHAGAYFREEGKSKGEVFKRGRIINTTSDSGLFGNLGQSNYGAAKAGIAAFSTIIAKELRKYTTVNVVSPNANTRMTTDATPNLAKFMEMQNKSGLKIFDPANFAPLVVYLASDKSENISGEVFRAIGDAVWVYRGWNIVKEIHNNGQRFTPQLLSDRIESELMSDIPEWVSTGQTFGDLFTR